MKLSLCRTFACLLAGFTAASVGAAPTLTTLYDFSGITTPNKGGTPRGSLAFAANAELWGTTEAGGASTGLGTVYHATVDGSTFTSVLDFTGTANGSKPAAGLLLASDGNFYGTTNTGGADGLGTIFQVTPAGVVTTIYQFRTSTQTDTGSRPVGALIESDGYVYTACSLSGPGSSGTIIKFAPGLSPSLQTVAAFTGASGLVPGSKPNGVILARDGYLYGTTETGGSFGYGTVFRIKPTGDFTSLRSFGSADAKVTNYPRYPRAGLIQGRGTDTNLYGTSAEGGAQPANNGTIFKITLSGTLTLLAELSGTTGTKRGTAPESELTLGTDGVLYGVTRKGGSSGGITDRGTIFKVTTAGAFTTLIDFTGNGASNRGSDPRGALLQDNEGNFFGTTAGSGTGGAGTIFKLSGVLPPKATVITDAAEGATGTTVKLNGRVTTPTTTATCWFEYGLTTAYGSKTPVTSITTLATEKALKSSVTGLLPAHTYHCRLVALNGGGTTYGVDVSFNTGPNPDITTQPVDQLVAENTAATFTIAANGASPTYAWFKQGSTTKLGTAATYTLSKASLTNAGAFYAVVSDVPDKLASSTARLGVVRVVNSFPTVIEDKSKELQVTATGTGLTYQWRKDGSDLTDGGHYSGTTTAKLTVSSAAAVDTGVYVCRVSLGALTLDSGTFSLTTILRPVIDPVTLGPWTTNGLAFGSVTAQNSPTNWVISPLPKGVDYNEATGVITATRPLEAGLFNLSITAKNAAGFTSVDYTLTVLAASANASGSYAGIVARDGTANNNLGGRFTLTLSSIGTGSGSLVHKGKTLNFSARLSAAPGSTRTVQITPAVAAGFPTVIATLDEATGNVTGSVNGAALSAKRNAASPGTKAGTYNLAFTPATSGDPAVSPQGRGYGSITISSTGVVTWTGSVTVAGVKSADNKLADGTTISGSSYLASDGTIPWHFGLYAVGTGSAQGWFSLDGSNVLTEQSFDWLKLDQTPSTTRGYKTGFALQSLQVDGAKYAKPATGVNVLGLTGSSSNAKLVFSSGGLASSITQVVNLPSTNVPTIVTPSANTVKLTFDLSSGHFYGTFVLPDAVPANVRTVKYSGVLIPGLQKGFGCFQLPQLTPSVTTSPLYSGEVVLEAN